MDSSNSGYNPVGRSYGNYMNLRACILNRLKYHRINTPETNDRNVLTRADYMSNFSHVFLLRSHFQVDRRKHTRVGCTQSTPAPTAEYGYTDISVICTVYTKTRFDINY